MQTATAFGQNYMEAQAQIYQGRWGARLPTAALIISGTTKSYGPQPGLCGNMWLIKTNSLGDTLWTQVIRGVNEEECYGVPVKRLMADIFWQAEQETIQRIHPSLMR